MSISSIFRLDTPKLWNDLKHRPIVQARLNARKTTHTPSSPTRSSPFAFDCCPVAYCIPVFYVFALALKCSTTGVELIQIEDLSAPGPEPDLSLSLSLDCSSPEQPILWDIMFISTQL
jgi:hypothetical protein